MSEFKFNCPYCLQKFASDSEDIGKAAICPFCQKEITITPPLGHEICDVKYTGPKQITIPAQTEQTPQPKPGDVQVNAKDSVAGCVGCLVVIAILIGLLTWLCQSCSCTDPSQALETEAWHVAMRFVEKRLKAPSTAKFPNQWDNGVEIKRTDNSTFCVSAFVDAENSFGAKIRQHWSVTVRYNEADGHWYRSERDFY